MTAELTEERRATLRGLCDTIVPRIEREHDPDGFWARTASEVGADEAVAQTIATLPEEQRAGLMQLLDALAAQGLDRVSHRSREQLLRNLELASRDAAAGLAALTGMTLFFTYGVADPQTGQNPKWRTFGYPGPIAAPGEVEKPIAPLVLESDTTLEADVVVVGSGAGGGVIAGTLAQAGQKVVVLEAGGYFNEADFNMLELWAFQNLYWRGGPIPTADMNVSLQAGANLGGGTTVNWTNCLRTRPWVREQWAREHGLEGVDGADYDAHMDAVLERIGATEELSDYNDPTLRMKEGAERLGWSFARVLRNADPSTYSPETAAYMGFGDQSGSKQSTQQTFLLDAAQAGAEIVVRCAAERILVEGGRATGVQARYTGEDGREAGVVIRAPRVVVACGSLESPALLLRSGIGGPAVGQNLRLHPCTALIGMYTEEQRAWWGAPHTGLIDEFANVEDGYGFLLETAQYTTGVTGSAIPFTSGAEHKQLMAGVGFGATCIGLLRDHGGGRVTIDGDGQAVPWYSITDELDLRNTRRALEAQVRLQEAAGAYAIYALATGLPGWRRGDDLDEFIARLQRIPLAAGGHKLFSAHQMGSCQMGTDPQRSVAGPWGELHDTPGVFIGDGSAFPTSSGTNPMISIMALARRTATAMLGTTEPARTPAHAAAA